MSPQTTVPLTRAEEARAIRTFGRAPRTTAVPLLPPDAPRDVWREARRLRVGASEMAAVLSIPSAYASPFSLWWSKQDGWPDQPETDAMKIGTRLEPIVGELFAERYPEMMVARPGAGLWGHPEHEFISCTPDFLAVRSREHLPALPGRHLDAVPGDRVWIEPVETKTDDGGKGWGKPGTDEVPDHHACQVAMQCEIMGAPRGYLVRMANKRLSVYVIEYNSDRRHDVRQLWIPAASAFVASLHTGVQPPVDEHTATGEALSQAYPAVVEDEEATVPDQLARQYDYWSKMLDEAKSELALVKHRVREAMKRSQFAVDSRGKRVFSRSVGKRDGYEVGPGTTDTLRRIGK